MTKPQITPYGSWKSPVTAEMVASEAIRLSEIALDGRDIYWQERRPTEGGRSVIVRRAADGRVSDITPPAFNARTRVHEYGGGAFAVHKGVVYFANFADQRLYRQDPGREPRPLTPEAPLRYADMIVDPRRERLVCVHEDHTRAGEEATNTIVGVGLDGRGSGQVLVSGSDFYAFPRLSPDGSRLAWQAWNHPNMPWDGSELWVAEIQGDGALGRAERVAGGESESIFQPQWSPGGTLYFVSDRSGWWNLYRWREGQVEPLLEMEAEFGLPQWVFGRSTYAFASPERLICSFSQHGTWQLADLNLATGQLSPFNLPYTVIEYVQARAGQVVFLAGSPSQPPSVVRLDLASGQSEVLRRASSISLDSGYLSEPAAIEFPTEQGLTAHGLFYRPKNRDVLAPDEERPPLLVLSHGGPTGATSGELDLGIQFWTSRGFAVLDVNYGGSTGYGRDYRRRLDGRWGLVDVDDCLNGARYLVERGQVDRERLAIRGGSAGGYTTLAALTFRDLFKAGASYFGVSDLEALTRETHKFESRYLDRLIGPYPERLDLYRARSPIHHTGQLSCPVIFFQGLEDLVVPPNQAETMVEALRAKGVPVAYLPFEGEQHGFRRAENIQRCLEAELYFYAQIFGFALADPVEPVEIENL
ncbi:MAG: S9 family peptidase [Anaerolineae bacterium]